MSCDCPFTGASTCHCAACHYTFSSITAFDLHQRLDGDRLVCVSPVYARTRMGKLAFKIVRRGATTHESVWGRNAENTAFTPAQETREALSPVPAIDGVGA